MSIIFIRTAIHIINDEKGSDFIYTFRNNIHSKMYTYFRIVAEKSICNKLFLPQ